MNMTRRSTIALLGAGYTATRQMRAQKFQANWESLKQYRCPDWFADAKFGIWAHWGPQVRRGKAIGMRETFTFKTPGSISSM